MSGGGTRGAREETVGEGRQQREGGNKGSKREGTEGARDRSVGEREERGVNGRQQGELGNSGRKVGNRGEWRQPWEQKGGNR